MKRPWPTGRGWGFHAKRKKRKRKTTLNGLDLGAVLLKQFRNT
jgi:hypothetical protein